LKRNPIKSESDLALLESYIQQIGETSPLIPDGSIDVVISNCVLNLVDHKEKTRLFREIYRALKRGGRAAISDIVSDEPVSLKLQQDPELWSGCVSGALQECEFLRAFEDAGFYGITIAKRDEDHGERFRASSSEALRCWLTKEKKDHVGTTRSRLCIKGRFRRLPMMTATATAAGCASLSAVRHSISWGASHMRIFLNS